MRRARNRRGEYREALAKELWERGARTEERPCPIQNKEVAREEKEGIKYMSMQCRC